MRYLLILMLTFLTIMIAGCGEVYKAPSALEIKSDMYHRMYESNVIEESPFAEDQEIISNEAIDRILSSTLMLPEKGKLSIIRFSENRRWRWSEELTELDEKIMSEFVNTLLSSKRLENVSYIPTMLVPQKMTISRMRGAAARTQSNLLLIYRTSTQTYEKTRLLGKDETKAYSTVEAILMDIRTGIIPFSSIKTETFTAVKTAEDLDFYETIQKAEQQAVRKALNKIAIELNAFLETAG